MHSLDVLLLLYLFLNNASACKFFKIFKMSYNDGNFDKTANVSWKGVKDNTMLVIY